MRLVHRLRELLTPFRAAILAALMLALVGLWLLFAGGDDRPDHDPAPPQTRASAPSSPPSASPSAPPRQPAWNPTAGTPVAAERDQASQYAERFTAEWLSWSHTDTKNPLERASRWATDDWAHSIAESLPPPESTPTWRRIQADELTLRTRVTKVRFVTERQYTATYRVTAMVDETAGEAARKTFDVQMRLVDGKWLVEGFAEAAG